MKALPISQDDPKVVDMIVDDPRLNILVEIRAEQHKLIRARTILSLIAVFEVIAAITILVKIF